jgi:cystathionine beta-lyase
MAAVKYFFDQVPSRRDSDCIKWQHYDKDVLPLWVADMDFPSPEPVIRALQARVEHGVFGYPEAVVPDPCYQQPLRQAVIDHAWQRYGWKVEPDELIFIPGVVTGFNQACQIFAESGGGVLIQTPVYTPILAAAGNAGLDRQEMELTHGADGTYTIDRGVFEAALTDQTRLFLLCNPHNPVGRVFRREELEFMAETCLKRGALICSDEIHCDLVFSGHQHLPIASLDPEIARNTITLIAPSKTYNLAGLQCSVAVISNPELRDKYRKSAHGLVPWVNLMGLAAAEAAYREGQEWLEQLLAYLKANRDYLSGFIKEEMPSIRMAAPEGTYLAWLDCRESGIEGSPYEFFLKQARVALSDGRTFGRGGSGFVRLNFGCPRSIVEEALNRMKTALVANR